MGRQPLAFAAIATKIPRLSQKLHRLSAVQSDLQIYLLLKALNNKSA